jgi:hypothetical protein
VLFRRKESGRREIRVIKADAASGSETTLLGRADEVIE